MTITRKVELQQGDLTKLSEATGASLTHLHFVLKGERVPSKELARKIANYFGKQVADLFPELVG